MPGWADVPGSPVSSTLMSHLYFGTASPSWTKPGPAFTERALCTCRVMLPGPLGAAAAVDGAAAAATAVVVASCARGSSTVASATASRVLIDRPWAV